MALVAPPLQPELYVARFGAQGRVVSAPRRRQRRAFKPCGNLQASKCATRLGYCDNEGVIIMQEDKASTRPSNTLLRLMKLMGRLRWLIPLSGLLALLAYVAVMLAVLAIWMIIRQLLLPAQAAPASIVTLAWQALAASVGYLLLYFAALMTAHRAAFRVEHALRYRSMQRALAMPLGFHEQQSTGRLKRIIDDNAGLVHTFTAHNLPDLFGILTCLLLLLVALPFVDWRMGLICLIPMALALVALGSMMTNKAYQEAMGKYMHHLEGMNAEAVEYVRGMPVVKAYQQSIFTFIRFHKTIMDYTKWATRYAESCRKPMVVYTVATAGFAFLLVPLGLFLIYRGEPAAQVLSNMVFYLLFTPFFGQGLMRLMYVVSGYRQAGQALDGVEALFAQGQQLTGTKNFTGHNFSIELQNVSFRYTPEAPWALNQVSLTIPQGRQYALVGASGSGKTTIARLVARFWDPTEGSVRIGGHLLRDLAPEQVLRQVSFVFQDDKLFKTTIRNNITYGCPEASQAQIDSAVKMAQCEDIIAKLPRGLDTPLGTQGIYLSGGECQRIALARAFLKDSPILLLDEATAFADPENERALQNVLHKLMQGRTVLLIAHRLSSVVNVDQIIVLRQGHIVEQGSHQALLAKAGLYAAMWAEYQKAINWTV